jgi:Zn-dependent protease/CBS domain-containing protein
MSWSVTIGRIAGTAVRIHITFLLFLAWIGFSAFRQGGAQAATQNIVFIVLLFLCVVLHEFGHIFMARRFGIRTPDVTLLPIGGVASLERIPEKPSQELAVALAGPAVNLVIALLLIAVLGAGMEGQVDRIDDPALGLATRLAAANVFLALFNMIPAFPMDGGRVLRALLAMWMGRDRGTQLAARIGQGLAFLLGFLGLFGNPILLFIAIFVFLAAEGEARDSALRNAVTDLRVGDAMETRVVSIPIEATLAQAVDVLLSSPQHEFPIVDGLRKPVGILVREDLIQALASRGRDDAVSDIMRVPVVSVRTAVPLPQALNDLAASRSPAISVVDADGVLVGLLTRENIAEMMMIKSAQPDWVFRSRAG